MANGRYKQLQVKNIALGKFFIDGKELPATSFDFSINDNDTITPGIFCEIETTSGVTDKQFNLSCVLTEEKYDEWIDMLSTKKEDFEIIMQFSINGDTRTQTWTGCKNSNRSQNYNPDDSSGTISGTFREYITS